MSCYGLGIGMDNGDFWSVGVVKWFWVVNILIVVYNCGLWDLNIN